MNGLDLSPVNLSIIGAILGLVFGPRAYAALKAGNISMPKLPAIFGSATAGTTIDPHDEVEVAAVRGLQQIDHCLAQNGVSAADRKARLGPVAADLLDYTEPAAAPAVVVPVAPPSAPIPQTVTHSLDSNLSDLASGLLTALQAAAKAGA